MPFSEFDLLVSRAGQEFEAHVLRSPAGEARHRFALPFQKLELENLLLRLGRDAHGKRGVESDATRAAKQFGGRLFDAVFAGGVRTSFEASLREAQASNGCLRIRLRVEESDFADVPWEFLFDRSQEDFLALSSSASIIRYLEVPQPSRPVKVSGPLRVAALIASPKNAPRLDTEKEWQSLKRTFAALPGAEVERVTPTLPALQEFLRRGSAHVFHFIGHGGFDDQQQDGFVLFENDEGNAAPIPSGKLSVVLRNHSALRLAVLNCCEGARTAPGQPFSGVAPALVRRGLPAVVAMQFAIADTAAIVFAETFYQSLCDGLTIDRAVVEARMQLYTDERQPGESFGAPVLYMRSDDGVLFDIDAQPARSEPSAPPPPPIEEDAPTAAKAATSIVVAPAVTPAVVVSEPAAPPGLMAAAEPAASVRVKAPRPGMTGSILFGIGWMLVPLVVFTVFIKDAPLGSTPFALSMLFWTRIAMSAGGVHALMLYILTGRHDGQMDPFRPVLATGLQCGIAAAAAWAGAFWNGASAEQTAVAQVALVVAVYTVAQLRTIRRQIETTRSLIAVSALAAACLATFVMPFLVFTFTLGLALLSTGLALLTTQGVLIHRAEFIRSGTAPPRRKMAFELTVVILLFLLTFLPLAPPQPPVVDTTTTTAPTKPKVHAAAPEPPPGPTAEEVATQGAVEGIVKGKKGEPYVGAKITAERNGEGSFLVFEADTAASQTDGYYSLGLLQPGRYTIVIAFPHDVQVHTSEVIVSAGKLSIVNASITSDRFRSWSGKARPLLPNSFRKVERYPAAMYGAVAGSVTAHGALSPASS